jgi:hypothetical protein
MVRLRTKSHGVLGIEIVGKSGSQTYVLVARKRLTRILWQIAVVLYAVFNGCTAMLGFLNSVLVFLPHQM